MCFAWSALLKERVARPMIPGKPTVWTHLHGNDGHGLWAPGVEVVSQGMVNLPTARPPALGGVAEIREAGTLRGDTQSLGLAGEWRGITESLPRISVPHMSLQPMQYK